ncbi:ECF transporter S component [Isoptericola sp. NEAU-Y5]|uniref:ECF transporter S component n=1 Tax=Isoptericola luteus TaxID=2879484 RepID=A0ABS7ZGL8_9MICO|nr:ECF transporter S component [Isoptericola sp. NEAU-Y5]MCA5894058.1 ECF transporter S component [Isoptericola sp. NEAU-Y5]
MHPTDVDRTPETPETPEPAETPDARRDHGTPGDRPVPALRARRPRPGLHDTVLLAVLAVVFGFVFWVADQVYGPLLLALGPFGGFADAVLGGAWIVVAPLALFILRRPGAGLLAEVLAAGVELVVFGSPFGPMVLVSGLVQGAGAELAFALTRYRRWGWGTFALSGVTAAAVTYAYQTFANGYLGQDLYLLRFAVLVVSCVLLSGLAARALGLALLRTGVLDNYPVGRAR